MIANHLFNLMDYQNDIFVCYLKSIVRLFIASAWLCFFSINTKFV
ncbi:Hypothetical protein EAG7_03788 [Klebsiella aerogenes]|nr:Hypothetical protein EAG7_03788 [Klebsiella aerogenes]PVF77622.1 hypothetical protein CSC18_0081 [Klebsiella aerogenes]CCG32284.1 hypothetical protein [Klebsiella aerogenes EA1509E]